MGNVICEMDVNIAAVHGMECLPCTRIRPISIYLEEEMGWENPDDNV